MRNPWGWSSGPARSAGTPWDLLSGFIPICICQFHPSPEDGGLEEDGGEAAVEGDPVEHLDDLEVRLLAVLAVVREQGGEGLHHALGRR